MSAIEKPYGRWDMHCHSAPCMLPRWGTATEVAREAARRGYEGILILAHHASTFREAILTEQTVPGVRVIGGVVLNRVNGGLSDHSIRIHLAAGVRLFSLPTFDASAHVRRFGSWRSLQGPVAPEARAAEISILAPTGLTDEARCLLDLLSASRAVLCSGHIGSEELEALVPEAAARGLTLLLNHPYFLAKPRISFWDNLPACTYLQFAAVNDPSDERLPKIADVVELVRRVGADRCMLGSQASGTTDPLQRLDEFLAELATAGLSNADIAAMAADTPRRFVASFLPRTM